MRPHGSKHQEFFPGYYMDMSGKIRDLAALAQPKKPPSFPRASFGCSGGGEYLTMPRIKSLFPVHSADIPTLIKA